LRGVVVEKHKITSDFYYSFHSYEKLILFLRTSPGDTEITRLKARLNAASDW
jgi:hypothetical protein